MEEQRKRKRRRSILLILLLAVLLFAVSGTAVYYWTTKKLPLSPTEEGPIPEPHFLFSIGGVVNPVGVAVSPDSERIFVTEAGGERLVRIFDSDGDYINSFSRPDSTASSRNPVGIAVSNDGKVYVSDGLNRDVTIYTLDGDFIGYFVPDNDTHFEWMPIGLAFDEEGDLYVTDQTNPRHEILVFGPSGDLKLKFGYFGVGEGMFNFPTDVAVGDGGTIYVSDSNNVRLQSFDSQSNFIRLIVGDLSLPYGIGFDEWGRLHVVDSLAHRVLVFSLDGEPRLEYSYGSEGLEEGQFWYPRDVALDGEGRIYVTDSGNNRVDVWSF